GRVGPGVRSGDVGYRRSHGGRPVLQGARCGGTVAVAGSRSHVGLVSRTPCGACRGDQGIRFIALFKGGGMSRSRKERFVQVTCRLATPLAGLQPPYLDALCELAMARKAK